MNHAMIGTSATVHSTTKWRAVASLVVLALVLAHLSWEHTHGGVKSHHFLQRADMPAMSNWWNLLLLPVLAWWLGGRVVKSGRCWQRVLLGGGMAVFAGIALSSAFLVGWEDAAAAVFGALILSTLVAPLFRSEYFFGLVLGLTATFGAVIALTLASVLAAIAWALQRGLYPVVERLWRRMRSR